MPPIAFARIERPPAGLGSERGFFPQLLPQGFPHVFVVAGRALYPQGILDGFGDLGYRFFWIAASVLCVRLDAAALLVLVLLGTLSEENS